MDAFTVVGLVAFAVGVGSYGTIIGAGGGFVLIPGLVLLFDLAGAEAVGTGTVALAAIGVTGALAYDRRGLVDRPVAGWFTAGSVPLALIGSWFVADRIDSTVFIAILGVLLLALAALVVFVPPIPERVGDPVPPRRPSLTTLGSAVGLVSGTFAVGGGLLTLPAISRLQHLTPHRATATTAATASVASLAGVLGHSLAGNVKWSKAVVLVIGAVIGSLAGARLAGRLTPRQVLALVAIGLVAAGVPLLLQAAQG